LLGKAAQRHRAVLALYMEGRKIRSIRLRLRRQHGPRRRPIGSPYVHVSFARGLALEIGGIGNANLTKFTRHYQP
jgi:hypothetical protein